MKQYSGLEIAVIGMSGRFPGAAGIDGFWENLKKGAESISFFTDEQLLEEGEDPEAIRHPNYVRARGVVEGKENFDSAFFNYTADEARLMDPQTRIFHECVWTALENAGCNPKNPPGKIGLFAGASTNVNWMVYSELANRNGVVDPFTAGQLSNAKFMATHVSYALDLCGPSVMLDTGCSTSLVAIQQACKSLLMAECAVAVAGGINIRNSSQKGYIYTKGMTNSGDGHCRAFDAAADGTIGGEGAAVVVLKTLKNALKDGDHIYAIIKGNGINNDGNGKVGYTAPSVDGQAEAILMAHKWAKVEPESIGMIEAHGTATELGDPIEVEALNRAFGKSPEKFCALGSVKTNIGHLDAAAGAAGFIKAALSLYHRQIPASLHFKAPNPRIDFSASPFFVNTTLREWTAGKYPLRAGVSSFGIGGTNAHIVLEEAPDRTASSPAKPGQLLTVSAKSAPALRRNLGRLLDHLRQHPEQNLADIAYTLQTGRTPFPYRATVVCDTLPEAAAALAALLEKKEIAPSPVKSADQPKLVFMFPGQGAQYPNMCADLYRRIKTFRETADQCFDILQRLTKKDLRRVIFSGDAMEESHLLTQTKYAQPALFTIEYSLAVTLMSMGIKPDRLIGHSFGEYVAACLSGVFSLSDALSLLVKRGSLMQRASEGKMLGISIPEKELLPLLASNREISLSTVNGPELCVVAGSDEAIAAFTTLLESRNYSCKVIPGAHAYHSHLMDGILAEYNSHLQTIKFGTQNIPVISNLTGSAIADADMACPAYWVNHLRKTVRFSDGVDHLLRDPNVVLLEVGPGVELATFVRTSASRKKGHRVISLVRHSDTPENDYRHLLTGLGRLWTAGIQPDWTSLHRDETRIKIPLPAYDFEPAKYPAIVDAFKMIAVVGAEKSLSKDKDIANWFHTPSWKLAPLAPIPENHFELPLILADPLGIGDTLSSRYPAAIIVRPGASWIEHSPSSYELNPQDKESFPRLARQLTLHGLNPDGLIHAWGLTTQPVTNTLALDSFFYSLADVVRALMAEKAPRLGKITLLTNDVHSILENTPVNPAKAMTLALLKVIGAEYAIDTCAIDIDRRETLSAADTVYSEIASRTTGRVVALSLSKRWEQVYNSVPTTTNSVLDRTGGVYLITGGLGAFGLTVATWLLHNTHAKVALVSRRKLSEQPLEKIGYVKALQQEGEVRCFDADVRDQQAMTAIIAAVESEWGPINGVFHAAGIIGGDMLKPVDDLDSTDFGKQFAAKVEGLQILDKILGDKPLDFCMLISSLSPILGGIGFGAYAPANAYMDHYIRAQKQAGRLSNWISANIDGFELTHDAPLSINKHEIMEVLQRALSVNHLPQVIASATELEARLQKWVFRRSQNDASLPTPETMDATDTTSDSMTDETTTPTQKTVLRLWRHFFGRTDIGLDDDFFETGGDSLKAITFSKRINKEFGLEMAVTEFFKKATVRALAEYIDAKTSAAGTEKTYAAIPRAAENSEYPLSSAQRRLYFLYEFDPSNLAYVMPMSFRVKGMLDSGQLNNAFQKLIARHESLRTAFVMSSSGPVQQIIDAPRSAIEFFHATEAEIPAIIKAFVTPFDLAKAPLIKVGLVQLAADEHILLLSMHHIITDGVSGGVLLHDLITLYEGISLPQLPLQYKDYSVWQQSDRHREELAAQRDFWLAELADIEGSLTLPTDHKRPAIRNFEGKTVPFRLGEQETAALDAIAKEHGASMYMVLLSIVNILLHRLSNQEDILMGTVTSGRSHADIEKIIGMFVNTLVLRNQVKPDTSFSGLLRSVKEKVLAALDNQGYQFEDLLTDLKVDRDPGRTPLFDVMFNFDSFNDHDGVTLPGLSMETYRTEDASAKFDLNFTIHHRGKEIHFSLEYATSLFREETIRRFIAYLQNIVSAVIGDPQVQVQDIDILAGGFSRQLLVDFNDTKTPYATEKLLHQLFEERTAIAPDATAIIADGKEYSYRWLNESSNRLAHFLREKGVKRETAVVVIMERGVGLVIALLGILKAGGKYVPVEPYVPDNRVIEIGNSVEAAILITDAANASHTSEAAAAMSAPPELVCLDEMSLTDYPCTDPEICNSSEDLAYVIFTSGSTGKPKGVAVQHRPVINLIEWIVATYDVDASDKLLFVSSISFDLSVFDLFGILAAGGQIRIAGKADLEEPDMLAAILATEGITFWDSAPAMLQQVIPLLARRQDEIAATGKLRLAFLSGDWIPLNMPVQMKTLFPQLRFIALGGATEATVWSNFFEVEEMDPNWNSIPYGKPINNAKYLVLDKNLRLCPIGVPGDLYIGGECLAVGYFNDKELSDRKFIPSPFDRGEKLYNTGDMARWFPDGNIEFLGRKDSQVKIRGYRIELGEIESSLLKFPSINQVLAQVIEKSKYDKSICAYYVAETPVAEQELRDFLSLELPPYMVPKYFVHLTEIPVTNNGKVDRKRLPAPQSGREEREILAPASPTEKTLAGIWADLLHLQETAIGVTDDFFELGGHSILAVHLMNQIRQAFSVDLRLRKIFDNPTIRRQGVLIDNAEQAHPGNAEVSPATTAAKETSVAAQQEYYICSPAQERLFYEQWLNKETLAYNVFGSFEVTGGLDIEKAKSCLQQLVDRHEGLRTSFHLINGNVCQKIHPSVPVAFTLQPEGACHDLAEACGEFLQPFDLAQQSLFRCRVVKTEDAAWLLIDIHHIVCDGLSMNILMNEFRRLYQGEQLPQLHTRYVDFAQSQKQNLQALGAQKEFWSRQLAAGWPMLNLQVNQSDDKTEQYPAAVTRLEITGSDYRRIKRLLAESNISGFMFFLSLYYILLSRMSGNREVVIASDSVGRTQPEYKDLVGTFINLLPLIARVRQEESYRNFLHRVRQTVLDAFENQEFPFDEMLSIVRTATGIEKPEIEAHFAFAGYIDGEGAFDTLEFKPVRAEGAETTQYGFKIEASEQDGSFVLLFIYSKALYTEDIITLFAQYYQNILAAVLSDSWIRIGDIQMEAALSLIEQ